MTTPNSLNKRPVTPCKKTTGIKTEAKAMTTDKVGEMGKKCGPDCKMACCSADKKEIKASVDKDMNKMKAAHGKNCDCEGCKTASIEMHKHKDGKENHEAHAEGCKCEGCAKS